MNINSSIDFSIINNLISTEKGIFILSSSSLYRYYKKLNNSILVKLIKREFNSIDKFYNNYVVTKAVDKIVKVKNDSILKTIETKRDINSVNFLYDVAL